MKTYKGITKEKGLEIINYQNKFFGKKIWENAINPLVLAAGTSAGKTITSLISLEIFYSDSKNSNKRTLVVPASKTVLRDNYSIELEKFNPNFGYFVATNKKELEEAINDKSYQVIIALPQTISRNYKLLPKIHNFILDEAHQWYFKNTIQTIIKHIKPTKQLLLTGTPSRFIAKGNGFDFFFVPVMDLYNEDRVSNIKIEVVSSSYDFKQKDYLSNYGNLKVSKTNSAKQAKDALSMVCDEMILKLRSRLGNKYLSNLRGANKISSLFNDLDKTIIFCHSVKQSNAFFKELNSMKGLKDKVLLSHSDNDKDSEYFETFRTQSEYKVLVAVDRGKLGYNLPDLFNVVDFTLTQSLDMILQMMGRILRLSDKDKQKTYFKVATKNTAGYFVDLMTGALCLFTNDSPTYYYSSFNGKNMGGILIPKVLTKSTKSGQKSMQSTNGKKGTQQLKSLEELGIPLDLNLFKQDIMYSQSDKFGTIAWTTLDECKRKFFNITHTNIPNTIEEFNYIVKENNLITKVDLRNYKGKNLRKLANRFGVWNNFPNAKKGITDLSTKEFNRLKSEALKYSNRNDFKNLSPNEYNKAARYDIKDEICKHMELQIKPTNFWNKKTIKEEALKYKSKTDFMKKSSGAFQKAYSLGIIDNVCKHMEVITNRWNIESAKKEALKYNKKYEFSKNCNSAYNWARRNNCLDKITLHMK
jgi:superfamily II DNA or RNA helicase